MAQEMTTPQGSTLDRTNQQVMDILFDSDDVTWKQIIFGLVQANEMNPWDLDISLIAKKFLEMLKELKAMDFRVSGKIVLASAVLLKLKSDKLMDEEIAALENLINSSEEPLEFDLFEEHTDLFYEEEHLQQNQQKPQLVPKTPQPRKRKVSVYDLVEALEKALEVDIKKPKKTTSKGTYKQVQIPTGHKDISEVIKDVYLKINTHYTGSPQQQKLTFNDLLVSEEKQDKVMTFIPLLHLDNQRKIDVLQEQHFGDIEIDLLVQNADLEALVPTRESIGQ